MAPACTAHSPARLVVRPPVTADLHPDPARNPFLPSNELPPDDRTPRNTTFLSQYVVTAPPSPTLGGCHRARLGPPAGRFRDQRGPASARAGAGSIAPAAPGVGTQGIASPAPWGASRRRTRAAPS